MNQDMAERPVFSYPSWRRLPSFTRMTGHTRFKDGELLDIPEQYHRETWEMLRRVVADVCNAAIAKSS